MTKRTRDGDRTRDRTLGLLLLMIGGLGACAAGPRYRDLKIVHTNDVHGHVETAAAVAVVAREEKARNPNTLFLDAGDQISGTPLSTVYQGRPIYEIMTLMGYDAAVLGNHEFDYGWKLIGDFRRLAGFPLLCANADGPDGKALADAPFHIFERGGVKIGVLGLVTSKVPTLTTAKASAGCTFPSPIETAKRLVPELRKKCDMLICLTHIGVEADAALAGAVPGIDVIVGGHTHTELKEPLVVEGTVIVQAKSYGTRVGILDLKWDTQERRITEHKGRLVIVDPETMPNHPEVKKLVDSWEARVDDRVKAVIGHTSVRLDKKRLRTAIERIYKDVVGGDFGYQNSGGIRGTIPAGDVTIRDVWTVLPFDNTLVRLTLRGDQLPSYHRRKLGDDLDLTRKYVFATNSYVGDQRAKYFDAPDAPVEDTGLTMRDVVVNWVREHGGFDPKGKPLSNSGER